MSLIHIVLVVSTVICFTQAGPALARRRTILGPQVSQTQMILQEDFTAVESQALHTSMQISNIVQWITKESFRVADEARTRLEQSRDLVLQTAKASKTTVKKKAQQCIRELSIEEELDEEIRTLWNRAYQCTHSHSDKSVKIEKKMTILINSARAHIIQTMDAMWLCELKPNEDVLPWSRDTDKNCLISFREEGKEINHVLPERANELLADAKKFHAETHSVLQKCMVQCVSVMSEKSTALLQKIKDCTKRKNNL